MLKFHCAVCGQKIGVADDAYQGRVVKCPRCGESSRARIEPGGDASTPRMILKLPPLPMPDWPKIAVEEPQPTKIELVPLPGAAAQPLDYHKPETMANSVAPASAIAAIRHVGRRWNRSVRSVLTMALCGIGLLTVVWFAIYTWRTTGPATVSAVQPEAVQSEPVKSPPSAAPTQAQETRRPSAKRRPRITYDQAVAGLGNEFILDEQSRTMTGEMRVFGKSADELAGIMLIGTSDDLSYLHIAVRVTPENVGRFLNAESLEKMQAQGPKVMGDVHRLLLAMRFVSNCAPQWDDRHLWMRAVLHSLDQGDRESIKIAAEGIDIDGWTWFAGYEDEILKVGARK